ncbi:MAG: FixH family protein [Gaiellaceae bacterium]
MSARLEQAPALLALIAAGALAPAAIGGKPQVVVGPGAVAWTITAGSYRVAIRISPNAAGRRLNTFVVRTTRDGKPVTGGVSIRFTMPAMGMPPLSLRLSAQSAGVARNVGEKLTMPGRWNIVLHVVPRGAPPFDVALVDVVGL